LLPRGLPGGHGPLADRQREPGGVGPDRGAARTLGVPSDRGSPPSQERDRLAGQSHRRLLEIPDRQKFPCLILGDMERHAPWFQLVAVVLVVVGLVTLAAPAPANAMDPQLILALASAAGAVALVVGYLIVANNRESKRAASLEGVYA